LTSDKLYAHRHDLELPSSAQNLPRSGRTGFWSYSIYSSMLSTISVGCITKY